MSYRYSQNPSYYHHPQASPQHHQRHYPPSYRYYDNIYNKYHQQQQHQHQQPQQQPYHDYSPKARKPTITRSSSTGTNHRYYDTEEEQYYREYGWYYPQEIQHVPPQQQNRYRQQRNNKKLLDEDGEPFTELELLALENAAKNEIESKRVIFEEEPPLVKDEAIEGDDLSSVMESLTIIDSSSTLSTMVEDDINSSRTITPNSTVEDNELKVPTKLITSKKKRWPFSFLFKRDQPTPTKSISTPPTPVLSPDNESSLRSSIMSASSSSPTTVFDNEEGGGIWAFRYPTPFPMAQTVWIPFDMENQKKIFHHLKSNQDDDVVQFKDSHICGGKLPIAVVPIQMRCYIPTDAEANQITFIDLRFIPASPNNNK